jgi:hypothetical protein
MYTEEIQFYSPLIALPMDIESVVNKSEWIGQHKVWASAPPKLRKLATEFFLIPQEL